MKVLVSTCISQGAQADDFKWVPDDEIVIHPWFEGSSGGAWSWMGIECHRSTTTAIIVDRPDITRESFIELVRRCYRSCGFGSLTEASAHAHVDELLTLLNANPVSTIVRRSGEHYATKLYALHEMDGH